MFDYSGKHFLAHFFDNYHDKTQFSLQWRETETCKICALVCSRTTITTTKKLNTKKKGLDRKTKGKKGGGTKKKRRNPQLEKSHDIGDRCQQRVKAWI